MIDFTKRIGKSNIERKVHPVEIYDSLDRASDKGELRQVQKHILDDWWDNYKSQKDIILKLHTGQGKTLIGLLILQSNLNQGNGSALYLCPTINLVNQTCEQASQFGLKYCTIGSDRSIPTDFFDSKAILITTVQKLFNGLTKFGLNNQSEEVGCVILDDSHACINAIKKAFTIVIKKDQNGYKEILELFEVDLEEQGYGTFSDIKNENHNAFLPIPYWAWKDKYQEVTDILSKFSSEANILFAWQLIRDIIGDCQCIISGSHLEIAPYLNLIEQFGTFSRANQRILMSATTNDDSFFIKGLGLNPKAINQPLIYPKEKWSGEKMILIPSLIGESLTRQKMIEQFGGRVLKREYGVAALVPSFAHSKSWEEQGSQVPDTNDIDFRIDELKNGNFEYTKVFANRYDGIDLADKACRILIIDSKPYGQNLTDRYEEHCRVDSDVILVKIAQKIEQGLGRSVRGQKDYSVIILIGSELISTIRSKKTRKFFSPQTQTQINIGIEIAEISKEDVGLRSSKMDIVKGLIKQCLLRDEGWKQFYKEQMDNMNPVSGKKQLFEVLELEKKAEEYYQSKDYKKAVETIQKIIDNHVSEKSEKGWYLQQMARYIYPIDKIKSNKFQLTAHKNNKLLMKPIEGLSIEKLGYLSQNRVKTIKNWISQFDDFEQLIIYLDEVLNNLQFKVKSDKFEQSLDEIGQILGFNTERPDKYWKQGPDNLWCIRDGEYILFECKNEVLQKREEINKDECGQMNNSISWFERNYSTQNFTPIMIIPTKTVNRAGGFNKDVGIMRKKNLKKFVGNVRNYFQSFREVDLKDISEESIQDFLNKHSLGIDNLKSEYTEKIIQRK